MPEKLKSETSHLKINDQAPIKIEKFKAEDKVEVVKFILQVQQEFGLEIDLEAQPDLEKLETAYESFWVAKSGDKIIGTIACIKLLNGDLVWKKWYVDSNFRKHGVGKKLIEELKNFAKKQGVINIWIGSIKEKFVDAVEYYAKIGAIEIEKSQIDNAVIDYPHNLVDTIFFRLPINLDPYHKYSVSPTYEELQNHLKQKIVPNVNLVNTRKQLRDKMLSFALSLSMFIDSKDPNSITPYIRYLNSSILHDTDNLNQLYFLSYENEEVLDSDILIDYNKPDSESKLNMDKSFKSIYLNIYISGYAIESLKITKSQLKYNPLVFDRIWIQETQNIISRLEKIHKALEI